MGANFVFTSPRNGLTSSQMSQRLGTNSANKTDLELFLPDEDEPQVIDTANVSANKQLPSVMESYEKSELLKKKKLGEIQSNLRDTTSKYGDAKEYDYGWLAFRKDELAKLDRAAIKAAATEWATTTPSGGKRMAIIGDWHEDTDYYHFMVTTHRINVEEREINGKKTPFISSIDFSNNSISTGEQERFAQILKEKAGVEIEQFAYSQTGHVNNVSTIIKQSAQAKENIETANNDAVANIVATAKAQAKSVEVVAIERDIAQEEKALAAAAERLAIKKESLNAIHENVVLTSKVETLEIKVEGIEKELLEQGLENEHLQENNTEINAELNDLNDELAVTAEQNALEAQAFKEELSEKESNIVYVQELLDKSAERIGELDSENKDMENELLNANAKLEQAALDKEKIISLESENASLVTRLTNNESTTAQLTEAHKETVSLYKATIESLTQRIDAIEKAFNDRLDAAIEKVVATKDSVIEGLQSKLETMKTARSETKKQAIKKEKTAEVSQKQEEKPAVKKMSRREAARAKAVKVEDIPTDNNNSNSNENTPKNK